MLASRGDCHALCPTLLEARGADSPVPTALFSPPSAPSQPDLAAYYRPCPRYCARATRAHGADRPSQVAVVARPHGIATIMRQPPTYGGASRRVINSGVPSKAAADRLRTGRRQARLRRQSRRPTPRHFVAPQPREQFMPDSEWMSPPPRSARAARWRPASPILLAFDQDRFAPGRSGIAAAVRGKSRASDAKSAGCIPPRTKAMRDLRWKQLWRGDRCGRSHRNQIALLSQTAQLAANPASNSPDLAPALVLSFDLPDDTHWSNPSPTFRLLSCRAINRRGGADPLSAIQAR